MKCELFIPSEHRPKVEAILNGTPLIPLCDNEGNIHDMDCAIESFDFFSVVSQIAPFVKDGGYIEDVDDYDKKPVRWAFHGGKCYEIRPQMVWPEPWNGNFSVDANRKRERIKFLKETYLPGVSIRLLSMFKEPQMPSGTTGVVSFIDGIGQIHVNWQNGSSLALNCEVDSFIAITGPTACEYLSEKLGLTERSTVWYRENTERLRYTAIDIEKLTEAAERYMEKVIDRSKELFSMTFKPYDSASIIDAFINDYVLSDDDMRWIWHKTEYTNNESDAGHCPKCGSGHLDYELSESGKDRVEYPWTCRSCDSSGIEYGVIEFDGHIVATSPDFNK